MFTIANIWSKNRRVLIFFRKIYFGANFSESYTSIYIYGVEKAEKKNLKMYLHIALALGIIAILWVTYGTISSVLGMYCVSLFNYWKKKKKNIWIWNIHVVLE